jgi:hypothetical protein
MATSRAYHKRSSKRFLKWAGIGLVLFALFFHVLMKSSLGPAYVEMRIKQTLSEYWSAPVRVGKIEFGYDGVMFVRDIIFYDRSAKEVMKASAVKLVLGNWPSLMAPARRINVDYLDVHVQLKDGRPVIPVRFEQGPQNQPPILEYLAVRQATVSIGDGKSQVFCDRLSALVNKEEHLYKIKIVNTDDVSCRLRLNGVFDWENSKVEVELKFAQTMQREQMALLLSAMKAPQKWECEGKVEADLKARGSSSDAESLWPEGVVKFEGWTIFANQDVVAGDVNGVLAVTKRRFELSKLSGAAYKGSFNGSFYLDMPKPGPVTYGGDVLMTGIDLAELTGKWETPKRFTQGTGLLNLKFNGDANGIESLRGTGSAFIDDADLWRFPVIGELFKSIGIGEFKAGGMSDAEVVFRLNGPQMTIVRGRLSNPLSAIEAEPNGVIDLKKGQIDMYVVALPLKKLDKVVSEMPVMSWFMQVKDKLIRLHLKGHWSEPAGKLISKQPIKDTKEGTIVFFKAVADSGGQIIEKIKDGFKFIVGGADNGHKDEQRAPDEVE